MCLFELKPKNIKDLFKKKKRKKAQGLDSV